MKRILLFILLIPTFVVAITYSDYKYVYNFKTKVCDEIGTNKRRMPLAFFNSGCTVDSLEDDEKILILKCDYTGKTTAVYFTKDVETCDKLSIILQILD